MLIDKLAYRSRLRYISPAVKSFYAFVCMIICIALDCHIINAIVFFTMFSLIVIGGGTKLKTVINIFLLPLSFIILGAAAVCFTAGNTSNDMLLSIGVDGLYLGIGKQSFDVCMHLITRCIAAVSCMYFLTLTTPMLALFSVLRKSIVPDFVVEIMELIYRYIFILYDISNQIYIAQSARLGYASIKTGYKSMGILIANLFARAYRQAEMSYVALESRGYEGEINTIDIEYKSSKAYHIIGVVYIIFIGIIWIHCR
ncbi:MAG: cobalt ECF transporter T component CbiQ [Clostridia bacterium]|nr:cobalt ECF transporter T component CbiQ [Clostridia bacterium]